MPTKKTFDLIVLTAILVHPVFGTVRVWARRQAVEGSGATKTLGTTLGVFF